MPFTVSLSDAKKDYPDYTFVSALTPSEQKAAFHVTDADGSDLCLKIIAPNSSIDRLDREILALQSLNHPNVVSLLEYTFSSKMGNQRHYLIEEFIDGDDLTVSLQPNNCWTTSDTFLFFRKLLEGLSAVAQIDVVHRDLKPSNIRVRANGEPVIIDFGVCRHLGLPDLTKTSYGAQIGTPAYFAPEQFSGTKRDIDQRTDLFAIGVLMHQALLGTHPFFDAQMTIAEVKDSVCNSTSFKSADSFKNLPKIWQLIVSRFLMKERSKRPNTPQQALLLVEKAGVAS